MTPNSITITYKSKRFALERVNAGGKLYRIGFEADKLGVRVYELANRQVRIIIEKSVKRDDGGTGTQFMWDCYCVSSLGRLVPILVCDPATCKRITRKTKWLVIEPMLEEIYTQLKTEIDTLLADSAC